MSYKALVLDLDGTLTNSRKIISTRTKEAIMNIQERGIKVILASGRSVYGMQHIADELRIAEYGGYMLSFNGAIIRNPSKDEILYAHNLDVSIYPDIFRLWKEYGVAILSYNKEHSALITDDDKNIYAILDSKINNYIPLIQIDNFEKEVDFPLPKFLFLDAPERLESIEKEIKLKIGDRLDIYRSEPCFLEIMPKGIDKGASLKRLGDMIAIKQEEFVACGDSYNDISMIKYAGMGVAMGNAVQAVKDVADYITASNDEDGVAEVIERFFAV